MKKFKLSIPLACISWISLYALTWLLILDLLPIDEPVGLFWLFFLVIAILSSAVSRD